MVHQRRGKTATSTVAERLVRHATALVAQGRLAEAATYYEQAAFVQRRARRPVDEARCLMLLTQCRRLVGDLDAATAALDRVELLAKSDEGIAVAAAAERAEVAIARGELTQAIEALDVALRRLEEQPTLARPAVTVAVTAAVEDPIQPLRASLIRRRAIVRSGLGQVSLASEDFAAAAAVLEEDQNYGVAAQVLVERATVLRNVGTSAEFIEALGQARVAVDRAGRQELAGELDLLEGSAAVLDGRLDVADTLTRRARQHALDAVAPTLYIGASLALSRLADVRGDKVGAYEAIAVGWATLGDLMGADAAASVFEPAVAALRDTWGEAVFVEIRGVYEERRRAILARSVVNSGDDRDGMP